MVYFDILKYAEWNLSDVVPMPTSEHQKLHRDFERRNKEYGFLDKLMLLATPLDKVNDVTDKSQ